MPKQTPFHARLAPLNQPQIWEHWSGYLVAPRYQYSEMSEYYAIRNSAGLLDTSPLFKYRFTGADTQRFLESVLARDIRKCKVGQAQYTVWCDPAGYVVEDGVIMQVQPGEYWLTAAEPNLRYFSKIARDMGLENLMIEDISTDYGILALQGPHSATILKQLTDDVAGLGYFKTTQTTIANKPVTISRTGYTGDLGYELWIQAEDAVTVWDALMDAGEGYNITPMGLHALKIARVEAGLLLLDVDFHSARFAWVDAQRETPIELGWGWMFGNLNKDDRQFIGREAIDAELTNRTSRWTTVGLAIDWDDYERIHREAGIMPPKEGVFSEDTMSIYRRGGQEYEYAGYASSFIYSSLLKRHIAIAKLPLDLTAPGTEVDLELSVIRRPQNLLAHVVEMPFYNPKRKVGKV